MNIRSIKLDTPSNNLNFKNRVTKKMLQKTTEPTINTLEEAIEKIRNKFLSAKYNKEAKQVIKQAGIRRVELNGNQLKIASKNDGYCVLNYPVEFSSKEFAENMLANELETNSRTFPTFGLKNFLLCINDLKRFDIIRSGIGMRFYEMEAVPIDIQESQAKIISRMLKKKYIKPKDLFYIEGESFYYDSSEKTIYSVNNSECKNKTRHLKTCKFLTDKDGNAIGYDATFYNVYKMCMEKVHYLESESPSGQIPNLVNVKDEKVAANAFRFGNIPFNLNLREIIPNILVDLYTRLGLSKARDYDLKFVKLLQKGKEILRISYYDGEKGLSHIYNEKGEYLYPMEYIRDANGELLSFRKKIY